MTAIFTFLSFILVTNGQNQVKVPKFGQVLTDLNLTPPRNHDTVTVISVKTQSLGDTALSEGAEGFDLESGNVPANTKENWSSADNIHLIVSHRGNRNSWNKELGPRLSDDVSSKSLCIDPSPDTIQRSPQVATTAALFSNSSLDTLVTFSQSEEQFLLVLDQELNVTVSPSSTRVFQFSPVTNYNMEEDETYLVSIKTIFNQDSCLYVGVHEPGCPWLDTLDTVRTSRMWARILETGYFPVQADKFKRGFTVSLVPLANSSECYTFPPGDIHNTTKILSIKVTKTLNSYVAPISVSITLVLIVAFFFLGLWILLWYCHNSGEREPETETELKMLEPGEGLDGDDNLQDNHNVNNGGGTAVAAHSEPAEPINPENSYRLMLVKEIREKYDERSGHKSDHCTSAMSRLEKGKLHLSDMVKDIQKPWHRRQRSKAYLQLVPLISLYYIIPSAQMVYVEFRESRETGNMEKCYLNYGCSRPYQDVTDFNHLISNLGYIIYGLTFLSMVLFKSKMLPSGHQPHEDHTSTTGPLQQHSVFYTMGVCMILQGILSCIFHLCPSNVSLQYDTTMMYIMMVLVFIKIFQLRHPDTAYNAYHVMWAMCVVLGFEAISLYPLDFTFRIFLYISFTVLYLLLMVHLAWDIYYYGAVKTAYWKMVPVLVKKALNYHDTFLYRTKFFLSAIFIVLNITLLVKTLFETYYDPGASLSTPLLTIFAINIGVYLIYYFVKKFLEVFKNHTCCGELNAPLGKIFMRLVSFLFFGLAIVFGIIGAYFYIKKHQSRNSTPPESRNKNNVCEWMDFYDNHDIWHFSSATALFLAFIGLLTIDDDLLFVSKEKIAVF